MIKHLAIVIPAYKDTYLKEALESICNQTNQNFNLYVFDDASPYDIKSHVDSFSKRREINYFRFEENMGKNELVKQWERCIAHTGNEDWVWLFSDDDVADTECVETFFNILSSTEALGYGVYRFNTQIINENGDIVGANAQSPIKEDGMHLALNIMLGNRGNSMPDHIWKRSLYNQLNGFIVTTQGQASDWASSINFALNSTGLYSIPAPPFVNWRYSGINISSTAYKHRNKLIYGHLEFLQWVNNIFTPKDESTYQVSKDAIARASMHNLNIVFLSHYRGIPTSEIFKVAFRIKNIFHTNYAHSLYICIKINIRYYICNSVWIHKVANYKNRISRNLKK